MAMAVDSRQQAPFQTMGYDNMRYPPPSFTNPWASASPAQNHMYSTAMPASSMSTGPSRYAVAPAPASSTYHQLPSMPTSMSKMDRDYYTQSSLQMLTQDNLQASRPYASTYSTGATSSSLYAPTTAASYSSIPYGYQSDRKASHPLHQVSEAERQSFSDALDASRGMVAMSQSDITPRANMYNNANNSQLSHESTDSYGFPGHSSHSSVSSTSPYAASNYYASSVSDASTGDYGSAYDSEEHMPTHSRTLPRPNGYVSAGSMPPAPQSMMGQFSSKVASSSQKKHKCKVCDKRFTRPSSLQTHMYSHTGEKPFACDIDGCGRHFSVVSNLRRHKKVHRGETSSAYSDDGSEE